MKENIGQVIKRIRSYYILRSQDVSKATGFQSSLISLWERGHRQPTTVQLEKFSKALGFTVAEIERMADKISDGKESEFDAKVILAVKRIIKE